MNHGHGKLITFCKRTADRLVHTGKDKRVINIMTSCDDGLAKYILPQLASIYSSLQHYHVCFYLVHSRISEENLNRIRAYANTLSAVIRLREIRIENPAPFAEMAKHGGGWAYEAYFSLCCHQYLPPNVERILYIDAGDVIICGDISEYYFADFEGHSLIATVARFKENGAGGMAAMEKTDMLNAELLRGIKRGIFNSGSYVINVNQLRADALTVNDFLYVAQVLRDRFPDEKEVYFGDQGLMSVAFLGDIKFFAYPQTMNLWYMPYNFCVWFYDRMDEPWYTPVIIHFAGAKFKPWQIRVRVDEMKKYRLRGNPNHAPFRMCHRQFEHFEKWWDYCAQTPIYDEANGIARACGKLIEEELLPLCQKYNELIDRGAPAPNLARRPRGPGRPRPRKH